MKRWLAFCLGLSLATPTASLAAQAPPTDPELADGIRQAKQGDFEIAVLTLDSVARRLSAVGGNVRELARAYLYLSIAYLGLSQEQKAKARFLEAWRMDSDLELSPQEFPPKILEFFEGARQEALASGEVAPPDEARPAEPKAEPARVTTAQPQKRGRSKTLPILIGVGAAAGVGIAVSAGGGGSDSGAGNSGAGAPPTSSTPTATFNSSDIPKIIADLTTESSSLSVSGMRGTISSVTAWVNIAHTCIGDLIVRLRHPDGTTAVLHERQGGSTDNIDTHYNLSNFNGRAPNGTWTLSVQDAAAGDVGRLQVWSLTVRTQ